jgi:hypothetical protein
MPDPTPEEVVTARAAEWRRSAARWLDYASEVTGERAKFAKLHASYCEFLARCWECGKVAYKEPVYPEVGADG